MIFFLLIAFFNIFTINIGFYGYILESDGIGQLIENLTPIMPDDSNLYFFNSRPELEKNDIANLNKINLNLEKFNKKIFLGKNFSNINIEIDILIITDWLWDVYDEDRLSKAPFAKKIIVYTMFESSIIPNKWVELINKCDHVFVPDLQIKNVYISSGISKPIEVLPNPFRRKNNHNIYKLKNNKKFIFGTSAILVKRKNILELIKAFKDEFSASKKVFLNIHLRQVIDNDLWKKIKKEIEGFSNISINVKILSNDDYYKFLSKLDCFVCISKGEGYCLPIREAMAIKIPIICTNSLALKTICDSGLVKVVNATQPERAYYDLFKDFVGEQYSPTNKEISLALRHMYHNYEHFLSLSEKFDSWLSQFDVNHLKYYAANLIDSIYNN